MMTFDDWLRETQPAGCVGDMKRGWYAALVSLAAQPVVKQDERWPGDDNIASPFNGCQHRGYCLDLKANARRYLFIRQNQTASRAEDEEFDLGGFSSILVGEGNGRASAPFPEELDVAIDAALGVSSPAPHPDNLAVDRFAGMLKAKLAKARAKGRSGWDDPAWPAADINRQLHEHAAKGDPLDVAAYAMFLALRGEATTGAQPAATPGGSAIAKLNGGPPGPSV
ncbi:hypothetical protein [Ideonella livida]|uniref:Uncharacterized protein n=1 Tax=Ideonella livida TaxID=2707176 RepID=A0A7C9TIE2_9BURK|nr:hypothetical protein [Ideonella livida]NDY89745.1 hypothetical protein [Ideonella livida]